MMFKKATYMVYLRFTLRIRNADTRMGIYDLIVIAAGRDDTSLRGEKLA